jgi:hypothetical protein
MKRRWMVSATFSACAVAVALAVACSGQTVATNGDSGAPGPEDAGLSSSCPTQAPAAATACTPVGVECEYGSDVDLACNTIARCDASGWTLTPPRTSGCPTPPNPSACAATYGGVPQQQTCGAAASCTYPEGTCSCEVYCGPQYPVGHPCDAGTPMTWQCTGAGQACPAARPHVGSTCTPEGQLCNYGDCNSTALVCQNGTWHTQVTGCPISTRRAKEGVHYLTDEELRAVAGETLGTRLATYEYTMGDHGERLGFIIEDQPAGSPSVVNGKDRVDLYGYTSMAVATLKVQAEEIAALRREVDALREEVKRYHPGK